MLEIFYFLFIKGFSIHQTFNNIKDQHFAAMSKLVFMMVLFTIPSKFVIQNIVDMSNFSVFLSHFIPFIGNKVGSSLYHR